MKKHSHSLISKYHLILTIAIQNHEEHIWYKFIEDNQTSRRKENKDIVTSADHGGRSMITYIQNTNKENKIVTPVTFHIIQEQ